MKTRFELPEPDAFEPLYDVLEKIALERQLRPVQIISGELLRIVRDDRACDGARTIDVDVYHVSSETTGLTIYYVFAINRSMRVVALMFKSVLDQEEQKIFDNLKSLGRYNEAIHYLSENTF
ncbi:hypothetical protein [Nitrosomonas marina]|uniref:Uncharacterized protein n=1 Tax=Nitrosomonas marina TaxID=917 RepID=A0A1H8AKB8_9PROT|nr:hypothetical protein [Nitrosomonas marina]SEM70963.1 hypothetical protein SAMN05216325_101188 [Nitrosomonas marina]